MIGMMGGWKTHFGCVVSIIYGIYLIVVEGDSKTGVAFITAGIAGEGMGHKIERIRIKTGG